MRYFPCLIFFFITSVSITGCQQGVAEPEQLTEAPDSLTYRFAMIERNRPCVDTAADNCIDIKIETIAIEEGGSEMGRDRIGEYLNRQIAATDNSDRKNRSPREVADDLAAEYNRILQEMPGYKSAWEYRRNFEVYLNQQGLLGTRLNAYSYTGGAHPADFNYYYTFDIHSGGRLSLEDLMLRQHYADLKEAAEKRFREEHGVDEEATYEDVGFWFENNEFRLSDNFSYSPQKLEFTYNPYDIAPYAEGAVRIRFDYEEIENWVKPEYRFGD